MTEEFPPVDSQAGFASAVVWLVQAAVAQRARRIVCMSGAGTHWGAWPLDDAGLQRQLTAWLRLPQRSLVLLAGSFDEVPRACPRFTAWRAPWAQAIECWMAPPELAAELPTLAVADALASVQLFDPLRWRGRAGADERDARHCNETADAVLQRSERGFPVNVLGL